MKYFVNDFHPLPLFYYLGALGAGSGVLSLLAGLGDEDRGLAGSLLLFLAGSLLVLLAMVFDLEQNKELELLLDR